MCKEAAEENRRSPGADMPRHRDAAKAKCEANNDSC
jgi:hypothetical protein